MIMRSREGAPAVTVRSWAIRMRFLFRYIFVVLLLALLMSPVESSAATFHQILKSLVENELLQEELNESAELGKKFCYAGRSDGFFCSSVRSLGQGICYAGREDALFCSSVDNIGEGICYAGRSDGLFCSSVDNIGEGICYAGRSDGLFCSSVDEVGEGICYAGGDTSCSYIRSVQEGYLRYLADFGDKDWDWDQFYDRYGSLVWMCRGVQTGQFADEEKCDGEYQTDRRWPRKTAP